MKQFQARIKLYFYVNLPDMTVNENLGPFFFSFFLWIAKAVWMASFKKKKTSSTLKISNN